jgi:hypothetical protein
MFFSIPTEYVCHYFFPAVSRGVIEGKLSNPLRLVGGHNFKTFDDPLH